MRRASRPTAAIARTARLKPASSSCRAQRLRATSCRSTAEAAPIAQGTTPIVVAWDYNALACATASQATRRPKSSCRPTGVVAGVYIQAISAYAPHPNAAKLWMEYLYSRRGPARLARAATATRSASTSIVGDGKVPQELLDALPAGRRLCQGRVPDARRAEGCQGIHHCQVGCRRRRRCPRVTMAVGCIAVKLGRPGFDRAAPRAARDRLAADPELGRRADRRAAVHHLRADVPDPAEPTSDGPGVPRPRRQLHPRQHLRARPAARSSAPSGISIRVSAITALLGAVIRTSRSRSPSSAAACPAGSATG